MIDTAIFRHEVRSRLGLAPKRIRDVFNMVELNTAIFECEAGAKHVPPWLEVTARSGEDLSVMPPGEAGILAYLDPTPLSYPGFVLSDDIGYVGAQECSCGRLGKTLVLQRRLKVVEERGCGRKMDRYGKGGAE
jgi:long-chain-fatty-acid---luciferin-component ligase